MGRVEPAHDVRGPLASAGLPRPDIRWGCPSAANHTHGKTHRHEGQGTFSAVAHCKLRTAGPFVRCTDAFHVPVLVRLLGSRGHGRLAVLLRQDDGCLPRAWEGEIGTLLE